MEKILIVEDDENIAKMITSIIGFADILRVKRKVEERESRVRK